MSDPAIKTEQYRHQAKIYAEHRDDVFYGLFHEMGLGKTKLCLDIASHKFLTSRTIQALLIVAPNSVYSNWTQIEAPIHMAAPYVALRYRPGQSDEKRLTRLMYLDPSSIDSSRKLRLVAMSYDALCTEEGELFAERLVKLYPTMMVLDESSMIKARETKRAKTCKLIGRQCVVRWICTGTPAAQSPFDVHSQIEFLDPDFWKERGLRSWTAFKQEFGVYESQRFGPRTFQKVTGYRNVQRLRQMLEPISSRLLKEDSEVQLPPKIYSLRTFELTPKQRDVYDKMARGLIAEIEAEPEDVRAQATLAVVRATRLQQICSGFVTADDDCGDVDPAEAYDGIDKTSAPPIQDLWNTGDPAKKDDSEYETAFRADGQPTRPISVALIEEGIEQAMKPQVQQPVLYGPESIEFFAQPEQQEVLRSHGQPAFADQMLEMHDEIRAFEPKRRVVDVVPPAENPRLELLCEILEECFPQKVIVFCRFTRDVDMIVERLNPNAQTEQALRYDGRCKTSERETALQKFRDPLGPRVLVANVHALSHGLTLTIAKTTIYFSNSFSLEKRLQSEDRTHRPGQDVSVRIVDIVAESTIDEKIVQTLRKKYDVQREVTGDRLREWITDPTGASQ